MSSSTSLTVRTSRKITSKSSTYLVDRLTVENQLASSGPIQDGDYLLIDAFAGTGGASKGFQLAGFKPVLIIEGDEKKQELYKKNFGDVEVYENNGTKLVKLENFKVDAEQIVQKMNKKIGNKEVKIHFHASPSCREFCPTGRKSGTKELGDSVGTFQWTVGIIGYLKKIYQNKMTWTIEDNKHLASDSDKIFQKEENKEKLVVKINNNKKFNYDFMREKLKQEAGEYMYGAYDFSLLGVPQSRVRFLAFDNSISFDKGKLTDEQLQKYMEELEGTYLSELLKHSNTNNFISVKQAFEYAKATEKLRNVEFTVGQASNANVWSLIRKTNSQLKGEKDENKKNKIYIELTKLAHLLLIQFIRNTKESELKDDKRIKEVFRQPKNWITQLDQKNFIIQSEEIKDYIDACAEVADKEYDKLYKDHGKSHNTYSLTKIKQKINNGIMKKILGGFITYWKAKPENKDKSPQVSDLNILFASKFKRSFAGSVKADGTDKNKKGTRQTRSIDEPSYTLCAQGPVNFGTYVKKKPTGPDNRKWFMTFDQEPLNLKILGTFPLDFQLGKNLKDAQMAVGDSVPPLITFRLGMSIRTREEFKEDLMTSYQRCVHAKTKQSENLFLDIREKFRIFLIKESSGNPLSKNAQTQFKKFNETFSFENLISEVLRSTPVNREKDKGFDQAFWNKWYEFFADEMEKITEEKLILYFTKLRNMKKVQLTKFKQKNIQMHTDRNDQLKRLQDRDTKTQKHFTEIKYYKNLAQLYTRCIKIVSKLKNNDAVEIIDLTNDISGNKRKIGESNIIDLTVDDDLTIESGSESSDVGSSGSSTVNLRQSFQVKLKF